MLADLCEGNLKVRLLGRISANSKGRTLSCRPSDIYDRSSFWILPRIHLVDALEMRSESPHFFGSRLEEKELAHHGEVTQYFQSIIDKMRDTELFADPGLLVSLTTESYATRRDP